MSTRHKIYNNQHSYKQNIVTGALILATISLGAILSSTTTNADPVSTSATASVNVASACSMAYNTSIPHNATMTNNTTSSNVGITTLTATCNDPNGLAIYAIGYSNNEYGNTNLIGTTGNIATGTNDTTSNWSMKLYTATGSITPSSITDTFSAVPSTYTKFAELSSGTTGSSALAVNATYKFHISATQPADTYTGKVKYTMVHPSTEVPLQPQVTPTGKICYYPNGGNVDGTMGCQNVASSVDLLASNFSRTGYGFAGWSDKFNYANNPEAKFYGPNETIALNTADYTDTNPGLSLYAVWVKSEGNLQDSSKVASVCSSLTTAPTDGTANLASVSALTDQRDNNTYAIAKLADNKCWMIESLRLADKDSSNNYIELSSTNTNKPSLPLTNIYDVTNPTTSNHLSASTDPTSTAWCTAFGSAACVDQSMLNTDNFTNRASSPTTNTGANLYSYGAYYNWYSATAGNGTFSKSSGNTAGDLCPAGWTLPTSGSASMDFATLYSSLSSTAANIRKYPNNFLYSGAVFGSSVSNRGSRGYYWSKSASGSDYTYSLSFYSSIVNHSSGANSKYNGYSIRCLAQ